MTIEQTNQYLQILCMAFSDLANDPQLVPDLHTAFSVIEKAPTPPQPGAQGFNDFIGNYEAAEREWLMQCGIDMDSAGDIVVAMRAVYPDNYDANETAERIAGRIKTAAKICCHEQTRNATEAEKRRRAQEMKDAFSGVVGAGVDTGVWLGIGVFTGPLGAGAAAPFAGYSVVSGLKAIIRGTRRFF